jgi:RNA dependent RNA polymerase
MRNIGQAAHLLQEANRPPLDYHRISKKGPDSEPVPANRNLISSAMVDFFVNYAKDDNLGQIGMLWQDHAAKHGADNWRCRHLAELNSIAVDFAKTGVPADIPKNLAIPRETPRAHWRDKKDSPSFQCTGILGRLFDQVNRVDRRLFGQTHQTIAGSELDLYGSLFTAGGYWVTQNLADLFDSSIPTRCGISTTSSHYTQKMVSYAFEQRMTYENQMIPMMNKYGLRCEGEVVTGRIVAFRWQRSERQYKHSEEVRRILRGTYVRCPTDCDGSD